MSKSNKYQTHHKIGVLNGKDVYFHPQLGIAIERGHMYLAKMTVKEVVAWYRQEVGGLAEDPGEVGLFAEEVGPDQRDHPSSVCRNVRLGREEW